MEGTYGSHTEMGRGRDGQSENSRVNLAVSLRNEFKLILAMDRQISDMNPQEITPPPWAGMYQFQRMQTVEPPPWARSTMDGLPSNLSAGFMAAGPMQTGSDGLHGALPVISNLFAYNISLCVFVKPFWNSTAINFGCV